MVSWLPGLQGRFVKHLSTADSWHNSEAELDKRKGVKGGEEQRRSIGHRIYTRGREEGFLSKKKWRSSLE